MATLTELTQTIATATPRTGPEMAAYIARVRQSIQVEKSSSPTGDFRGNLLSEDAEEVLSELINRASHTNGVKELAKFYGEAKAVAISEKAPQTAQAITKSAQWFWTTVEQPLEQYLKKPTAQQTVSRSAPAPSTTQIAAPVAAALPFYKKTWFLIAAPMILSATLGTIILLWPQPKKE